MSLEWPWNVVAGILVDLTGARRAQAVNDEAEAAEDDQSCVACTCEVRLCEPPPSPGDLTDSALIYELTGALKVFARDAHERIPALIAAADDRAAQFLAAELAATDESDGDT